MEVPHQIAPRTLQSGQADETGWVQMSSRSLSDLALSSRGCLKDGAGPLTGLSERASVSA